MLEHVDPFIGTAGTDLPAPTGLAATWWWPKPQVGNTHPGAAYPFGMVSACAYSGGYPTGYGPYELGTEGLPVPFLDAHVASGFTHFQQSGTGAIRKYYNYLRVTPMLQRLDDLGETWEILEEEASPGYYRALLSSGITAEITVGPKSAVHRYTFPRHHDARVVVDLSHGGIEVPYGATVPLRASLQSHGRGVASGEVVVEGAPLAVHFEVDAPGMRQLLWYDRRLMPGGSRLDFHDIRPTTLRTFGLMWSGPTAAGQVVELRMGFSLRGTDQARANLAADCSPSGTVAGPAFDSRRAATRAAWAQHVDAIRVDTPSTERRTVFATALYHSLLKPSFAPEESPFWPASGPFVFDISTMWDMYRTQFPLMTLLRPERSVELANALLRICEEEGNFPIGYRMARGADRFSRQASALAHTLLADLCALGLSGVDWDWALVHMTADLRRTYGEEYLLAGMTQPVTHVLDLAFGYWCTAQIAEHVGDRALHAEMARFAGGWTRAFDRATGLLRDSTFYEGTTWNYSFRLLHDMATRIAGVGGDEPFVALLDTFFGYGADPVTQPGLRPGRAELAAGYALGRFEGLNNEPDMDAPWAYLYAGRPDRTAEVVHGVVHQMFGPGRGGLPGNDDSGGLSSWYVWAALGLFPVAGQNLVLLHPPSFAEAEVDVPGGLLALRTRGFREPEPGGPVQYVESVTLDGEPLEVACLTGTRLHAGGELVVSLGDRPTAWGTTTRPPSTPLTGPAPDSWPPL
ncbi:MAG TPA: glycoside hydrolase [Micrococcales bacterium]|uniref:glycoside hydrolase domain-containing protein n=1 Tax=Miniimonas arenae TaxID=676201 RepID=UPI000EDA2B62|nr:glycoside hydrolase domain-containing protein [Miniimonas arenae]HCX84481.1 glycoside hydrolase [Micrococcales bacterium]